LVTTQNEPATPEQYIESLTEPPRTELARIHAFVRSTVPDLEPYMEGPEMIGYGSYHY
jgi:hypothetical protein